jgi:hypothetical protein
MNSNTQNNSSKSDDFMASFYEMYNKGMSWAEICYEIEEEEERQAEEERRKKIEEKMEERRKLYAIGKYDLEDGEVLE